MFFKSKRVFVQNYIPYIPKVLRFHEDHSAFAEWWLEGIHESVNYKRYSHNCRNCGASEIKDNSCAYCNTSY